MDAGVGTTRCMSHDAPLEESRERALEFELDGAARGLTLPPDERSAVEVESGEKCPAHRLEI
jgi:hypothetical protein